VNSVWFIVFCSSFVYWCLSGFALISWLDDSLGECIEMTCWRFRQHAEG